MVSHGTVVNGVIVPDGSPPPDGTRVVFEADVAHEHPHPLAAPDRDKELALLRGRVAAMQAGEPGVPLGEAMARMASELNLPPSGEE
ncbi:hypothetical protein [Gemmata sp.]|uniref:hypothetical protein n=1 Tax=Gemmata sp. TaxID=1914242 RepID=UPI003F725004